jgi:predicted DNA-binding antitoxin AbrB/MazE fold protein
MDPKTKKALKTAKSVQLKSGKNAEVVSPTSLNEEALQFIRAYKKSRPKQ